MSYEHLVALVAQDNGDFEKFYSHMCELIPALKGRGAIQLPPAGFKKALKTAYVAGDYDAMRKLISSPDSQP